MPKDSIISLVRKSVVYIEPFFEFIEKCYGHNGIIQISTYDELIASII